MADGRRNNGAKKGENRGQGRKPKTNEAKSMQIISKAILDITGEKDEEKAKVEFLKRWIDVSPKDAYRFINEHAIGKPKERQDVEISSKDGSPPVISFKKSDE